MLTRILTALVGIPLVLVLLFWPGGFPWAVAVAVVVGMALWEYTTGLRKAGIRVHWAAAALYAVALLLLAAELPLLAWLPAPYGPEHPVFRAAHFLVFWNPAAGYVGPALAVAVLLAGDLLWAHRAPVKNVGATLLGIAYIPGLFSFLILLRWLFRAYPSRPVDPGAWAMLCVLLVIWAGDSAAYFVGRAIGKHKCAPAISPNKTWEGVIGGLAASAVAGAIVLWPLFGWLRLDVSLPHGAGYGLLFGLIVGAAGQVGDLVESAMKREAGVKDFGGLLPGHGGILDRFDSLLFAAPTAYVLFQALRFAWSIR